MEGKLTCIHPKTGVAVMDSSGYLRPCCKYRDPYIFDESSSPNRIPTIYDIETLDGLHRHPAYVKLDREIGSGENPASCLSCWRQEQHGLNSRRLESNILHGTLAEVDGYIRDMEISLDFTCNMMCRICGPHSSSKWSSARKVIDDLRGIGADGVDHQPGKTIGYRDRFRRVLDNTNLSKVRLVKIQGGETFYSANLEWFVDKLHSEVENLDSLDIEIFTNGSIFPDDGLLAKLLRFRNLHVIFSVDAIGDLATATRWGVPWEPIAENCLRWDGIGRSNVSVRLSTNTTVSLLNVNRVKDVFDFFRDTVFKVNLSYLHTPNYLSIYMVPMEIRERWMIDTVDQRFLECILMHNSHLSSELVTENQFDVFLGSMAILDAHQGIRFESVNPEMHALARTLSQPKL